MSFLQNAGTAAMQVAILYVLAAVGFACDKAGIYTEKAAKLTNDLLFYIVTPAVVVQAFAAMERTDTTLRNLLFALLGGTALHGIAILLSLPFFRRGDKTNADIFRFACIYGNVGYMALPLANAVLGETGVFFCSGVLVPFNLFVFTHGVRLMSGTAGRSVFRPLRLLLNPGVIWAFGTAEYPACHADVRHLSCTYRSAAHVKPAANLSRRAFEADHTARRDAVAAASLRHFGRAFDRTAHFRICTHGKQHGHVCRKIRQGSGDRLTDRCGRQPVFHCHHACVHCAGTGLKLIYLFGSRRDFYETHHRHCQQ